jgi:holo-[acyl-carrier protein] synthase
MGSGDILGADAGHVMAVHEERHRATLAVTPLLGGRQRYHRRLRRKTIALIIVGLGLDLCSIERVRHLLTRYPRFAERCFTDHEREYAFRFARPERRLAARFAGKEAVMKSLGTGWRRIRWRDVEITGGGKPTVRLSGTAARRAEMLGVTGFEITITHTEEDAMVMAIALGSHDQGDS